MFFMKQLLCLNEIKKIHTKENHQNAYDFLSIAETSGFLYTVIFIILLVLKRKTSRYLATVSAVKRDYLNKLVPVRIKDSCRFSSAFSWRGVWLKINVHRPLSVTVKPAGFTSQTRGGSSQ